MLPASAGFLSKFQLHKTSVVKANDVKFYFCGLILFFVLDLTISSFRNEPDCSGRAASKHVPLLSQFGTINTSYALKLAENIKVFCIIPTNSLQYTSAYAAQNTWLRRCTDYGFVGDAPDNNIKFLTVAGKNKHDPKAWNTLRSALLLLTDKYTRMEYLVKADSDTYMIMENLRYMLEFENPDKAFLIGHLTDGHLFGSAGYVLSRGAVRAMIENGFKTQSDCAEKQAVADIQLESCALASSVLIRDSFDFLGKSRFSSIIIDEVVGPYPNNTPRWYPEESDYTQPNFNLSKLPASPFLASLRIRDSTMMYVLEYLLYHLRPSGITQRWLSTINKAIVVNYNKA